eukprot:CAMPEP_0170175232 /NCGR_PEP_ID=MMETSP0040_2-20121228/8332_1 /TAXON_ID=641309 /ORGANISM="Lotharella oceanica, Strain CCMP622" /LENGTH=366 /DNA_ID=CAMNT_0010417147 /DNA_START=197 /DNA_END=1297 /DNA_ORIENTATION=+
MPIHFTNQQKIPLTGSLSLERVNAVQKDLKREYSTLVKQVTDFDYSFEWFVWARLCVLTRVFGIEKNGRSMDALVPVADMLNHSNTPTVSWYYDDASKGFVMTAEKEIKKGSQVFDSYGIKSQGRFFVNYGFTIENLFRFNEAVISVTLETTDPQYKQKLPLLGRGGGGRHVTAKFTVSPGYRSRGVSRMLSYCRFVTATEEELKKTPSKFFRPQEVVGLNIRSEIRALKRLEKHALEALGRFPDPLHEDHKRLKINIFRTANERNCVVMRASEKEVLHWFIGFSRAMCDMYGRIIHVVAEAIAPPPAAATISENTKNTKDVTITLKETLGDEKYMESYSSYINDVAEELLIEEGRVVRGSIHNNE